MFSRLLPTLIFIVIRRQFEFNISFTTATRGCIPRKFFVKMIISFWDIRSICPIIFAKLDFFVTMSQMGVAYPTLKKFWAFPIFSQLCLAFSVLNILEKWKKKLNTFQVKDILAVLPYRKEYSGNNIQIIIHQLYNIM